MEQIIITVETANEASEIVSLLSDAEETERLDFAFNVERKEVNSTIDVTWSTFDVLFKAEEMEIDLTQDQAVEILQNIKKSHDCENGITWETIKQGIESFID